MKPFDEELISAYIDNELSEDERAAFRERASATDAATTGRGRTPLPRNRNTGTRITLSAVMKALVLADVVCSPTVWVV